MPRVARENSSTGIYHIVLRGMNRQAILEDEEDFIKAALTQMKKRSGKIQMPLS